MKVVLLIGLLAGLVLSSGATALALVNETGGTPAAVAAEQAIAGNQAETFAPAFIGPMSRPAVAQASLPTANGIEIRDRNPTCGVPFTVHVNVTNQSGQWSAPGTVLLQNFHRGTETINYSGSQTYPNLQPGSNYVVVFRVVINSYVSRGQRLVASTNGRTFSLNFDLSQGRCPRTSSSARPPAGGYVFQARHSGKCVDVPGGSRNSVTPVQQFSCTWADNQEWALQADGTGFFRIVSKFSGMCLDVAGASQQQQALVQQFPCNGGDNQRFSLRHVSGDFNMIVARHSGMCLDVRGASTANLAPIQQFPCNGGNNQQWRIR